MTQETLVLVASLLATFLGVLYNTIRGQRVAKEEMQRAEPVILGAAHKAAKTQIDDAQDVLSRVALEKFNELETTNSNLREHVDRLNKQLEQLKQQVKLGDEQRIILEQSLNLAHRQLETQRNELVQLREANKIVSTQRDIEVSRADTLERDLRETRAKLEQAEQEIQRLKLEVERLQTERTIYDKFFDRIQVVVRQPDPPPNGTVSSPPPAVVERESPP